MTLHPRSTAPLVIALALMSLSVATPVHAVPFDGNPKILLHLATTTTKNQCAAGSLADCTTAQVSGLSSGSYYFAYVLTAKGSMPNVAGAQFGVTYQDGEIDDIADGQGIDIFEWRLCATLQFASVGVREWPRPLSGNLITWDAVTYCQSAETAVLGYFYLGCYGAGDTLHLIPRPADGLAKLANCGSVERILISTDLGSVAFTPSGTVSGCNPCLASCPPPGAYPDSIPPAATTLALTSKSSASVRLEWTIPGDDGNDLPRANEYDLRYSLSPITPESFDAAVRDPFRGPPGTPGSMARHTVTGLTESTTYHFALKTADEVPNWSGMSNSLAVTTDPSPTGDLVAPAAVSDLAVIGTTSSSYTLRWTTTGDDGMTGTATSFDIRHSITPITEANYNSASSILGAPVPSAPGTMQIVTAQPFSAGTTRYFAMHVIDDVGNRSALSNVAVGTTDVMPADTTPPAAVADLAILGMTTTTMLLGWTSPGDDSLSGVATGYDIRYASTPITPANVGQATSTAGEPPPAPAGTGQQFLITALTPGTTYHFSLVATDDAGNQSGLSNVPSGMTTPLEPDSLPPARITDLAAVSAGPSSVALEWTAPGDDGSTGLASAYELRYSGFPITSGNFGAASAAAVAFPLPPGTRQATVVGSLGPTTLYYFALRTRDDAGQWSEISNVVNRSTTPSNGRANLMLHVKGITSKNACAEGQLTNCSQAVTRGDVATAGGTGPFYFVYLTVTDASTVGGLQCGISYDGDEAGGADDQDRIDIFDWVLCATLQFASPPPRAWPAPGSGNLVTWDVVHACQTTATPVAGYFYLAAYGSDTLRLTPRPADGLAMVADCSAQASQIPDEGLGTVRFSPGGLIAGVNPCGRVPTVGIERTTWSRIKTLLN